MLLTEPRQSAALPRFEAAATAAAAPRLSVDAENRLGPRCAEHQEAVFQGDAKTVALIAIHHPGAVHFRRQ